MALALTNTFHEFYENHTAATRREIFLRVLQAPWMSSGLTANNAFTTTLVLRTFGFLEEYGLFGAESGKADSTELGRGKVWELHLGITDPVCLARKLKEHADPASEFLWLSLSDKTRSLLQDEPKDRTTLAAALALDLARIIQSGWIYAEERFNKASDTTKHHLSLKPTGYTLAEVNHQLLIDQYPEEFAQTTPRSLKAIASLMAERPENFSINKYPPSTAVLYWFVDGIARANIALTTDCWITLSTWAANQFNHQRSLVVAGHDALMDPVAMAMSACLCNGLRAISDTTEPRTTQSNRRILPSVVELERSIEELISKQALSGIWHKYFPIFHYQEAGSNFCFTFELLEAVLHEFGGKDNRLLSTPEFIEGLNKAITWCEKNRKYPATPSDYSGWNSGGDLDSLGKEQPESWATAVVHMFLWELTQVVSERIQQQILAKYKASAPTNASNRHSDKTKPKGLLAIERLLDIDVMLLGKPKSLLGMLRKLIIDKYVDQTEAKLRRSQIAERDPRSALLFGPPGTSKTTITKAVARDLGWPLVEITPATFLRGTLANVYVQAEEIFDDLMDLSGVVVLFDEMDALVQTREGEARLDLASQFLTTTMLPKLTRLHDRARVVFFMATNFQDRFDAAIKRAGRFDLLLCMGPPTLSEKLDRFHRAYFLDEQTSQTVRASNAVNAYLGDTSEVRDQLELFTFDEFRGFLRNIGDENSIGDEIEKLTAAGFIDSLKKYSEFVTLKLSDLDALPICKTFGSKSLAKWKTKKFILQDLERKGVRISHTIRYLCDLQQSKEQY
jgi:hypothetical protein